jgi:hypothetical protein
MSDALNDLGIVSRVAGRVAAELGGSEEFIREVKAHLNVGDRVVTFQGGGLGPMESVYIRYYNLPEAVVKARQGGGAEAENNKIGLFVTGFGKGPLDPPPTGKVTVKLSVSALPRQYNLRAKSGPPVAIARYIADYLNKVSKAVEPNYTHTKAP